jgi:hypothetical protein
MSPEKANRDRSNQRAQHHALREVWPGEEVHLYGMGEGHNARQPLSKVHKADSRRGPSESKIAKQGRGKQCPYEKFSDGEPYEEFVSPRDSHGATSNDGPRRTRAPIRLTGLPLT